MLSSPLFIAVSLVSLLSTSDAAILLLQGLKKLLLKNGATIIDLIIMLEVLAMSNSLCTGIIELYFRISIIAIIKTFKPYLVVTNKQCPVQYQ